MTAWSAVKRSYVKADETWMARESTAQNAGGNTIELGARASQSTSLLSRRWQASAACANGEIPLGQAAATLACPRLIGTVAPAVADCACGKVVGMNSGLVNRSMVFV